MFIALDDVGLMFAAFALFLFGLVLIDQFIQLKDKTPNWIKRFKRKWRYRKLPRVIIPGTQSEKIIFGDSLDDYISR